MRPLSQRSPAPLVKWNIPRPQIQNFLRVNQRRSQRILIRNNLNFVFILAIQALSIIILILVIGRINLNIWIALSVWLITRTARLIACITINTCIATERYYFGICLAAVGQRWKVFKVLRNFRNLLVLGINFLNIVNTWPLGTFIVTVISA
jgi:hypothetical protein